MISSNWYRSTKRDLNLGPSRIAVFEYGKATTLSTQPHWGKNPVSYTWHFHGDTMCLFMKYWRNWWHLWVVSTLWLFKQDAWMLILILRTVTLEILKLAVIKAFFCATKLFLICPMCKDIFRIGPLFFLSVVKSLLWKKLAKTQQQFLLSRPDKDAILSITQNVFRSHIYCICL